MHMHKIFMKMHKKHRGPCPDCNFYGRHGIDHQKMPEPHEMCHYTIPKPNEICQNTIPKPQEMCPCMMPKSHDMAPDKLRETEHHKMHPPMFHKTHHKKHGKHHHKKHHRRSTSSSSSSSSESEGEFLEKERNDNDKVCTPSLKHHHERPNSEMFRRMHKRRSRRHHKSHWPNEMLDHMPEPGEVLPYMKPTHNTPHCKKHKIVPHKMYPRMFHKNHEIRPHKEQTSSIMDHHHEKDKPEETWHCNEMDFHKIHHHKMHKKHHHMKHRGRSSSHSSSMISENDARDVRTQIGWKVETR